MRRRMSLPGC